MKKQNGITLIALVITIIVLLILAGVSISMVTGEDGILARATDAVETHKEKEEKELHDLDNLANVIGNYENGTGNKKTEEVDIIEFGEIEWNEEIASIEISTNSNYEIEYQINGITNIGEKWNKGTTVTGLKHGDTVYARLKDEANIVGNYNYININYEGKDKIDDLEVLEITENSIEIKVLLDPYNSDISKFEFYINGSMNGSLVRTNYMDSDGYYTDSDGNRVDFYTYTKTFTGLNNETEYQIDIFAYDSVGNRLTTKKLVFSTK